MLCPIAPIAPTRPWSTPRPAAPPADAASACGEQVADLEGRLDATIDQVRCQRPSVQALRASIGLIEELQAIASTDRTRYETVIAPRSGALALWLVQLALVVAAAGLPGQGRALLQALPGVAASAFVTGLVDELVLGTDETGSSTLGGAA